MHGSYDLSIETISDSLFSLLYNLSQTELEVPFSYIKDNLDSGFISLSTSSTSAPIFLLNKKDVIICLCINFCGLNLVTSKNRYLLLLISEAFDGVVDA